MAAPKGTRPPNAGKGRKAGVPNRSTADVREAIADLLRLNVDNFAVWLGQVANGIKAPKDPADKSKVQKWIVEPDPAKALDLAMSMAEYHIPKLSRTEHTGDGGKPIEVQIVRYSDK